MLFKDIGDLSINLRVKDTGRQTTKEVRYQEFPHRVYVLVYFMNILSLLWMCYLCQEQIIGRV